MLYTHIYTHIYVQRNHVFCLANSRRNTDIKKLSLINMHSMGPQITSFTFTQFSDTLVYRQMNENRSPSERDAM